MAKKKKKNPIRLFHEKWKWYFVNAYIILAIVMIVITTIFHLNLVDNSKRVGCPKNDAVDVTEQAKKVIAEDAVVVENQDKVVEDITEAEAVVEEAIIIEEEKQRCAILVNHSSRTDYTASMILTNKMDCVFINVTKDISKRDYETIETLASETNRTLNILIIGGPYVLSQDSERLLGEIDDTKIVRLSGSNMESTGVAVIDYLIDDLDFSKAFITNASLTESLNIAAPLSADTGIAVYFVDYSGLSDVVKDALIRHNVQKVEIIGGGIGSKTLSELEAIVGSDNMIR